MAKQERGISRIDQDERHTHGWYVRVQRAGRSVAKFFPDQALGGKGKALAAARKFRDALAGKSVLPRELSSKVKARSRKPAAPRNKSRLGKKKTKSISGALPRKRAGSGKKKAAARR